MSSGSESKRSGTTVTKKPGLGGQLVAKSSESALSALVSASSQDNNVATKRKRKTSKQGAYKKPKGAPRRPLSAYNLFFKEERVNWLAERKQNGTSLSDGAKSTFMAMGKIIGSRWKELTPEQRRKYVEVAEKDKERYLREMDEYKKKVVRESALGQAALLRGQLANLGPCSAANQADSSPAMLPLATGLSSNIGDATRHGQSYSQTTPPILTDPSQLLSQPVNQSFGISESLNIIQQLLQARQQAADQQQLSQPPPNYMFQQAAGQGDLLTPTFMSSNVATAASVDQSANALALQQLLLQQQQAAQQQALQQIMPSDLQQGYNGTEASSMLAMQGVTAAVAAAGMGDPEQNLQALLHQNSLQERNPVPQGPSYHNNQNNSLQQGTEEGFGSFLLNRTLQSTPYAEDQRLQMQQLLMGMQQQQNVQQLERREEPVQEHQLQRTNESSPSLFGDSVGLASSLQTHHQEQSNQLNIAGELRQHQQAVDINDFQSYPSLSLARNNGGNNSEGLPGLDMAAALKLLSDSQTRPTGK